jgi:hypothetical protein
MPKVPFERITTTTVLRTPGRRLNILYAVYPTYITHADLIQRLTDPAFGHAFVVSNLADPLSPGGKNAIDVQYCTVTYSTFVVL